MAKKQKEAWERKAPPPVVALPPAPPPAPPKTLTGRHNIDLDAPLSHEVNEERWLASLAAIAWFDPRRLTDNEDRPISIRKLDDDTALALMGVELEEHGTDVKLYVTRKYKQADRLRALELIGKHKKWLVERTEQTGANGGPINVAVVDAELTKLAKELAERKKASS